jgi:hypothetical protein
VLQQRLREICFFFFISNKNQVDVWVKRMGSMWIIYSFIVRSLAFFGMPFLVASVCLGLCLIGW